MAPLNKQNVFLSFNKGVDTSTDEKLVIPTKFKTLDNLELDKKTTFRQRPGYTKETVTAQTVASGVAPGIVNVRQLHALGEDILLEADSGFHSFLQDHTVTRDQINANSKQKTFERAQVDYRNIAESQQNQTEVDAACAASASGLECWVWTEEKKRTVGPVKAVYYRIIDSATRTIVQGGQVAMSVAASISSPRVVVRTSAGASSFYVYYKWRILATGVTTIRQKTLTVASGASVTSTLGNENTIVTVTDGPFDAWMDTNGSDTVALAYYSAASTNIAISVLSGSDGLTIVGTSTATNAVAPGSISVTTMLKSGIVYALAVYTAASGNFVIAHSVKTTLASATTTVLGTPTAPGRVTVLPSPFTSTKALVFYDYNTTSARTFPHNVGFLSCDYNGTGPLGASVFARGVALAARPVAYYGTEGGAVDVCVPTALLSLLQSTVFMFKFGGSVYGTNGFPASAYTSPRVLARLFPGECGELRSIATLPYDTQTGNYTVGLQLTGATSKAIATIIADADAGATGTLTLAGISGVFQDNEIIADSSIGSATVNGTASLRIDPAFRLPTCLAVP